MGILFSKAASQVGSGGINSTGMILSWLVNQGWRAGPQKYPFFLMAGQPTPPSEI